MIISPCSRRHFLRTLASASALLMAAGGIRAEAPPAGLRVFYTGHSFHMFVPPRVDQLAKSAGIIGHRTVGAQGIGGSRVIQHWDLADDKNRARPALESGQIDVFTMAAHLQVPDPGIDHFVELGLRHNPKTRFLVQASWMPHDLTSPQQRIKENSERDETDLDALQAATDDWRKKLETQADGLNEKYQIIAVFIVPVGDAVVALRRKVNAGEFPGVAKQSHLFRDPIGHGLGQIQALAACCNFAAIYRRSPVGLKLTEPGVTDEQLAILEQIAWDAVSRYDHSGFDSPAK